MPMNLAHSPDLPFQAAADRQPVPTHAGLERIIAAFTWLCGLPRRIAERDQLAALSDRELADIGLTRGDIGRIHDPDFAADYAASRAVRGSLRWM